MGEQKDMLEESRQGEALMLNPDNGTKSAKKLYIESYGCQMNFSDSEIVASVLGNEGYSTTTNMDEADLIFLNTCSIRDKAEETIRQAISEWLPYVILNEVNVFQDENNQNKVFVQIEYSITLDPNTLDQITFTFNGD